MLLLELLLMNVFFMILSSFLVTLINALDFKLICLAISNRGDIVQLLLKGESQVIDDLNLLHDKLILCSNLTLEPINLLVFVIDLAFQNIHYLWV